MKIFNFVISAVLSVVLALAVSEFVTRAPVSASVGVPMFAASRGFGGGDATQAGSWTCDADSCDGDFARDGAADAIFKESGANGFTIDHGAGTRAITINNSSGFDYGFGTADYARFDSSGMNVVTGSTSRFTVTDAAVTNAIGVGIIKNTAGGDARIEFLDGAGVEAYILYDQSDDDISFQRIDSSAKNFLDVDRTTGNIAMGDGTEGTWTWDGATGDCVMSAAGGLTCGGNGDFEAGTLTLGAGNANIVSSTQRMVLSPVATYGVDIGTTGAKATCDATNDGSFFYENTNADSTAGILYMCMENASDVYSWNTIHTGT